MSELPLSLEEPRIVSGKSLATVTAEVSAAFERPAGRLWWTGFALSLAGLGVGAWAVAHLLAEGIGVWGLNRTVGWAFDITNFVFWIGIGHAGTLISAILFLLRQRWRTSVSRAAEAMTIFAVICAGLFPLLHMGRPWLAFWMFPYPNNRGPLWVNFRSPLVWDFFAIATYLTISSLFWYFGMIPDLATVRDTTRSRVRRAVAAFLSLGWTGSAKQWLRYETVYLLLAGLATPLVVSVHTIVSWDFATSVIPGWHATIFPPYFVAGAIFSGMAMVLTLMIVARATMGLTDYITVRHLDVMAKLVLATGGLVALAYGTELFCAMLAPSHYEPFVFANRMCGPFAWASWTMVSCNVLIPQLLWFRKVRTSPGLLFAVSLAVNVGMWFERFVIIVTSLHRDFLPSSWTSYTPTVVEAATLVGSFGLFFTLFLLFVRFVPVLAMAEVKAAAVVGEEHP